MTRTAFVFISVLCFTLADALIDAGSDDNVYDSPNVYSYNRDHHMVVCSCGKCGSTSLWHYVYRALAGHPWPYSPHEPPYVQDVLSVRWNHTFKHIMKRDIWPKWVHHKIAIVREPQERLLSAWKSKLACKDEVQSVNGTDRDYMVPQLFHLAGVSPVPRCLNFEQFVDILKIIKDNNDMRKLNPHFLPQQFGCFRTNPVDTWTLAAPISDHRIKEAIDKAVGTPTGEVMGHAHASKGVSVDISPRTQALLDEITADEYAALKYSFRAEDGKTATADWEYPTSATTSSPPPRGEQDQGKRTEQSREHSGVQAPHVMVLTILLSSLPFLTAVSQRCI